MMKRLIPILAVALVALACKPAEKPAEEPKPTDISAWEGIIINEIAAHDQDPDAASWIEILNSSDREISLEGLSVLITDDYFTDQSLWDAPAGAKLAAGERLVLSSDDDEGGLRTGISSESEFVLKLAVEDGTCVDIFDRDEVFADGDAAYPRGSYQRIPDGWDTWRNLTYSSRNRENKIFSLDDYKHTAIWTWSSHVAGLSENDFEKLKEFKRLGYDHILLNYVAFESVSALRSTIPFLDKCEELGIAVHCWMQCFYNGGWVSPVDDENKCYREDVYEKIRADAKKYIENFGIRGLHLDYIRFGGTASKHNPSTDVTAIGAVNRCCQEIREILDSYDGGLVASAALMPEKNSQAYYGQVPSQMGKYIHILMPMAYRYSYHWSDSGCKDIINWFANNSGDAQVWAGITTYTGTDSGGVQGMTAEAMRKDIDIFMDSKAAGLVLFRCGLGTFPDVNDLN